MKEKNLLTKEIASKIKQLLEEKNISQRILAGKSGIKEGYLGYLLRGEKRFNLIHIEKICKALSYPVAKLFEGDVCSQEEQAPPVPNPADPMLWALIKVYEGLSLKHKGALRDIAEELRLTEAMPRRELKKGSAAP